jgi:hypothetical protein
MNNQLPITPPPELIEEWASKINSLNLREQLIVVAQWGANQELEACCEWFQEEYKTESWVTHDLKRLRTARRPEPPSLKEQALKSLTRIEDNKATYLDSSIIRSALDALPNY